MPRFFRRAGPGLCIAGLLQEDGHTPLSPFSPLVLMVKMQSWSTIVSAYAVIVCGGGLWVVCIHFISSLSTV